MNDRTPNADNSIRKEHLDTQSIKGLLETIFKTANPAKEIYGNGYHAQTGMQGAGMPAIQSWLNTFDDSFRSSPSIAQKMAQDFDLRERILSYIKSECLPLDKISADTFELAVFFTAWFDLWNETEPDLAQNFTFWYLQPERQDTLITAGSLLFKLRALPDSAQLRVKQFLVSLVKNYLSRDFIYDRMNNSKFGIILQDLGFDLQCDRSDILPIIIEALIRHLENLNEKDVADLWDLNSAEHFLRVFGRMSNYQQLLRQPKNAKLLARLREAIFNRSRWLENVQFPDDKLTQEARQSAVSIKMVSN